MSSKKKKQPSSANTEILREQIQLVKAEKELKSALEKVNEQINKLLVSRCKNEMLEIENALTDILHVLISNFLGRRIAAEISIDTYE